MVQTWWQLRCNAELGWYVQRWVKSGNLFAVVAVEYGPMAYQELYDVIDMDTTAVLLELLIGDDPGDVLEVWSS